MHLSVKGMQGSDILFRVPLSRTWTFPATSFLPWPPYVKLHK